jgi:hypothetical protein
MTMLGDAAVAMWWNVADEHRTEFHEWHSKEHLPERLSIPGFHRGSRWQREGSGDFFVMYELAGYETLTSEGYLARLNNPTPWSTKMMPRHAGMVRSQCRVVESHGGGVATYMLTVRLSPADGKDVELEQQLVRATTDLPRHNGVTAAHFLRTETPQAEQTKEQQIRGGDAVADWILLVSGHSPSALQDAYAEMGEWISALSKEDVSPRSNHVFRLVHAMTSQDV